MQRTTVTHPIAALFRAAALLALITVFAANGESVLRAESIPSIRIGNMTYSNLVVREVADRSVTVAHSRGMATLSQDKLTFSEKVALGLAAPEAEKPVETASKLPKVDTEKVVAKIRSLGWLGSGEESSPTETQAVSVIAQLETPEGVQRAFRSLPPVRPMSFIPPVAFYVLISMCFVVICAKTGKPAPLLAWVPILQMYPVFRAANMSPAWFVFGLLNVFLQVTMVAVAFTKGITSQALSIFGCGVLAFSAMNALGWIIWCFKISKARGKSAAIGLLLLLPGINILALAYLAFSGGGTSEKVAPVAATAQPAGLRLMF